MATDTCIPLNIYQSSHIKLSAFHSLIHRLLNVPRSVIDFILETSTIKAIVANNVYSDALIDNMI